MQNLVFRFVAVSGGRVLGLVLLLSLVAGCNAPVPTSAPALATDCFLADTEEQAYSEVLQAKQRIVSNFEFIDGVRPPRADTLDGVRGHWIPAGSRRVQFRVLLPPTGWNDGLAREARGVADVTLLAGHRYRIVSDDKKGPRLFAVFDVTTGRSITELIDLGFFAPVDRGKAFVPIFIPIKY